MKLFTGKSCVDAWLQAAAFLAHEVGPNELYHHVILQISEPLLLMPGDGAIHQCVDQFLTSNGAQPVSTVRNTIFPQRLYQQHGVDGVYERYPALYEAEIKSHPKRGDRWGNYAIRMIRREQAGTVISPLRCLVDKIQRHTKGLYEKGRVVKAAYELNFIEPFLDLPLYDPVEDRNRTRGGPCLSHISFTVRPDGALNLTALYRRHAYVQKALGNLLGLADLQHFVATEGGLKIGDLVCISTVASVETASPDKKRGGPRFGKKAVRDLITECLDTADVDQ